MKKNTGHRVLLTIFNSNHVIPYGKFNVKIIAHLYTVRKLK